MVWADMSLQPHTELYIVVIKGPFTIARYIDEALQYNILMYNNA